MKYEIMIHGTSDKTYTKNNCFAVAKVFNDNGKVTVQQMTKTFQPVNNMGHVIRQSQNRVALASALEALKQLPEGSEVTLKTENEYVKHVFDYGKFWEEHGWKKYIGEDCDGNVITGDAIKNVDLVSAFRRALTSKDLKVSMEVTPVTDKVKDMSSAAWRAVYMPNGTNPTPVVNKEARPAPVKAEEPKQEMTRAEVEEIIDKMLDAVKPIPVETEDLPFDL